jgi:hypothetical protein
MHSLAIAVVVCSCVGIAAQNYTFSAPASSAKESPYHELEDCVDLNSGHAITTTDINQYPRCIKVSLGAGTTNVIPRWPNLLGKTIKVTLDISKVGCRNVLAFQMVDSKGGPYCDGSGKFGPTCAEIDFLEANEHVWGSTIHDAEGGYPGGYAKGYGGNRQGLWNYGPGGVNVDTSYPIDLNIAFPTDSNGNLQYIFFGMYQKGDTHPKATFTLGEGHNLQELTDGIRRGMLPGFSYWHEPAGGLDWFDKNNCNYDYPGAPAYFSNWQVVDNVEGLPELLVQI